MKMLSVLTLCISFPLTAMDMVLSAAKMAARALVPTDPKPPMVYSPSYFSQASSPQRPTPIIQEVSSDPNSHGFESIVRSAKNPDSPVFVNINMTDQAGRTGPQPMYQPYDHQPYQPSSYPRLAAPPIYEGESMLSTIFNYVKRHKKQVLLGSLAGSYLSIQGYLWYLSMKLQKGTCWSLWKQRLPLEELFKAKQSETAKEIVSSIKGAYGSPHNPTDIAIPLTEFAQDADNEMAYLTHYQRIVLFLNSSLLGNLFSFNTQLANQASERITRLAYMKSTVFACLAELKKH